MRDANPRLQEQAGNAADRHVDANTVLVHQDEGTVENIEAALLQKEHGPAFAHRERAHRRKLVHLSKLLSLSALPRRCPRGVGEKGHIRSPWRDRARIAGCGERLRRR